MALRTAFGLGGHCSEVLCEARASLVGEVLSDNLCFLQKVGSEALG